MKFLFAGATFPHAARGALPPTPLLRPSMGCSEPLAANRGETGCKSSCVQTHVVRSNIAGFTVILTHFDRYKTFSELFVLRRHQTQ